MHEYVFSPPNLGSKKMTAAVPVSSLQARLLELRTVMYFSWPNFSPPFIGSLRISVGLRSGLWLDHSGTFHWSSLNQGSVSSGMCLGLCTQVNLIPCLLFPEDSHVSPGLFCLYPSMFFFNSCKFHRRSRVQLFFVHRCLFLSSSLPWRPVASSPSATIFGLLEVFSD